jgi:hypothetical protein
MIAINNEECRSNSVIIIDDRFFIIQIPSRFTKYLEIYSEIYGQQGEFCTY